MNDEEKIKATLFRVLNKASKIANGLKIAAIPLLILNLLVASIGFYYFTRQPDMGHWGWGIPTLTMAIPVISVVAIIWILDAVTSVPTAVKNASSELIQIVKHHRKKLEIAEKKKLSKFRYLRMIGKILWEATDVMDGIGMASFVATPLFWFFYLGTFLGSIIFGAIMIFSIIGHHFFF